MAGVPLIKIGALILKQVTKPVANGLKDWAKRNAYVRNYLCIPVAQIYHKTEIRLKMLLMGFQWQTKVTPLNEQVAIELGAEFLAECFVVGVPSGLVLWEYSRNSAKSKAKEEALLDRINNLENKLESLVSRNQQDEEKFKRLTAELEQLKTKNKELQTRKTTSQTNAAGSKVSSGSAKKKRRVTLEMCADNRIRVYEPEKFYSLSDLHNYCTKENSPPFVGDKAPSNNARGILGPAYDAAYLITGNRP